MNILIDNLTKRYGNVTALDQVSLEIKNPGCYAVLGPNGAGKTTLFRVMSTIVRPDEGHVYINGYDVFLDRKKALSNVGFLVSVPEPPDFMKVKEFIEFSAKLRNKQANVTKLSELLDLPNLNSKCGNLSKGQKRRVYLAALLAQDPDILVLDEPTDGLDPIEVIRIKNVVRELKKDKIIVYASHILSEIIDICDYVFIMNKGKIIYRGSISAMTRMFRSKEIKVEFNRPVEKSIIYEKLKGYVLRVSPDGENRYVLEFDGSDESRKQIMKILIENFDVRSIYDSTASIENTFIKIINTLGGYYG